jgi:hypothetical protein
MLPHCYPMLSPSNALPHADTHAQKKYKIMHKKKHVTPQDYKNPPNSKTYSVDPARASGPSQGFGSTTTNAQTTTPNINDPPVRTQPKIHENADAAKIRNTNP